MAVRGGRESMIHGSEKEGGREGMIHGSEMREGEYDTWQ